MGAARVFLPAALSVCAWRGGELQAAPPGPAERWQIVFEDTFDGATLDMTKWNYHYPWGRTHNHEAYSREQNVTLRDGALVLTAKKESYGGMPYTTGVVNTNGKFHTTFGYLEARIKMPSSLGSWPAFWTLQSGWPPEIDIMEFPLSDVSQAHNEKYRYWWNYHWGTVSDHRSAGAEEWQGADLSAGFHDYAVEWFADRMRFYLDGELRGEVTDRGAIAQSARHYMILNYAVGGWPGSPPSWPAAGDTYQIDWVRVWQPAESDVLIDLGNMVGGGDGGAASAAPYVGINPATGGMSEDLDLDRVASAGSNPDPVASTYVDCVFLMTQDRCAVTTTGAQFQFPAGSASGSSWDLIADTVEADGAPGVLRLGAQGVFTRGIGMHASAGITFDLDAIRRKHGDNRVAFFSAFAGEGSLQTGGSVTSHVALLDGAGALLYSVSTRPHTDGGRFVEVEIPRDARFLTLASGAAGDGNSQDHGVFCNAFITPCSVSDPASCPGPADEMLVFSGAEWRYLDTGAAPPAGWTARGFSPTGWKTGRAQLGYGDGDESTEVDYGSDPARKRITTSFHRTFTVGDVETVTALLLRLLRDDGAIVYVNATEVLRSNMPQGAVNGQTLARTAIDSDGETAWIATTVDSCLLVEGTNVVAVEVHQAAQTSSDLSFDLALAATRTLTAPRNCRPDFVRGDANDDGRVDIADAVKILGWLFAAAADITCLSAANANGDATIDIADPIAVLAHLFADGPAPGAPYPQCGPGLLPGDVKLGCIDSHCN